MADEKMKSKSERRYSDAPTVKGGKASKKGEMPAAEAASTAAETAGKPEMTDAGGSDPGPEAGTMASGTEGDHIQVQTRHAQERTELMARHDKERTQMHGRMETDHKKMAARHTTELAGMTMTGSSAKTAGEKADATKKDEGKGGTEK